MGIYTESSLKTLTANTNNKRKENKMKYLIMVTLLASMSFAKDGNKTKIFRDVDEMTEKVSYSSSGSITLSEGKKAVSIYAMMWRRSGVEVRNLGVLFSGFSGCHESNLLIILLEDGFKLNIYSSDKFSCKEYTFFSFSPSDLVALSQSPIKKIMYRNGRTYESLTKKVDASDKNYFINMNKLLEKQEFSTRKKD
jgi:hypothetical protein